MTLVIGEAVDVEVVVPPTISVTVKPPVVPRFEILYEGPTTVTIESAVTPDLYIPALPGPRGEQGIPGLNGTGLSSWNHIQAVPSDHWVFIHPLTFLPAVTVVDSAGTVVYGDVSYSGQTITINFSAGFSGTAYLS